VVDARVIFECFVLQWSCSYRQLLLLWRTICLTAYVALFLCFLTCMGFEQSLFVLGSASQLCLLRLQFESNLVGARGKLTHQCHVK